MKTPILSPSGKDISRRFVAVEARQYLPEHLRERIAFDKGVLQMFGRSSLLAAFLIAPFLAMICMLIAPPIVSSILDFLAPEFFADVLENMKTLGFDRAFGLTLLPVMFLLVLWAAAHLSALKKLETAKEDLLLELAYRNGHDQSLIRNPSGGFKSEFLG